MILSERRGALGIATLNSASTLNSLTTSMIQSLFSLLKSWGSDDQISCVFLQGAGEKAFCAGGDVRQLRDAILLQRSRDPRVPAPECIEFFRAEYMLDYIIHRYPKPIVIWGDGIVMGGGIGLMVGASHRVVTERSKLAMPEITIGLYPDVAGTWFLNRMPSGWGIYLGLTGTRLNASDCIHLGLADLFIPSNQKERVLECLSRREWESDASKNKAIVTNLLGEIGENSISPPSPVKAHEEVVTQLTEVRSVQEVRDLLLEISALYQKDEWVSAGIKNFRAGSPSSASITLEQLRRGKKMSLEEVFRSELNLAVQCTMHPDFCEGVRALLVDKDQNPKWQPAVLEELTQEWIDSYFQPLWTDKEHPLACLPLQFWSSNKESQLFRSRL